MIRNRWYVVLESSEVPADRPVGVLRLGERLVIWRDRSGKLACVRDQCPHRGAALSAGKTMGDTIQCPFHGFEFDAQGRCQLIPCNGRDAPVPKVFQVTHYPVREAHGFVYLWWGEPRSDLPEPRFFDDIDDSFAYSSARDPWKAHYARVIENQLDVSHLPFLHYNTIGRGGRTLVDGPLVEWTDPDSFYLYVFNRLDDGKPPRKPRELSRPNVDFWLQFIFPNLWENHISEDVRVVAAFVPVDESNTILYLRFYQKFMKIPGLKHLVARLAMPSNVYIAHQDRRVVETQVPKEPGLQIGEKLVQADGPIIAYRRRREELQNGVKERMEELEIA